jgi:hypothetical protein
VLLRRLLVLLVAEVDRLDEALEEEEARILAIKLDELGWGLGAGGARGGGSGE